MGKWMNWDNPQRFTEKIQWLKVYGFRPEYTQMVDKDAVKAYVENIIGKKYIIPTLAKWEKPENIDWDALPEKFVLKTTHGGGSTGVVVCNSKKTFDKEAAIRKLNISMKNSASSSFREHTYKDVPRKVIAEKFLERKESGELVDFKFYCFNGKPVYCQVIRNRRTKETIDFYDMQWNHMPFIGLNPNVENGDTPVICPRNLETMQFICRELAKGIPFVRIDLYDVDDHIFFGEITFYPASGFGTFKPQDWDLKLGGLIDIKA